MRWDRDEPILCAAYSSFEDDSFLTLANAKVERYDILKCFCKEAEISFYDPLNQWRMECDFSTMLEANE